MGKDSKKSKKHKDKKHKSKKDKKKKKHYSSSSDSSSSDEWVEKNSNEKGKIDDSDEWMGVFSGKTRKELNENRKKDEKDEKKNILDEPGQSTRELNPFWKNGGTGLPSEESSSSKLSTRVGDGGVKWLRKAMQRAKEQAEEEGRSLESVVAERWGSMSEFNQLLRDAESKDERRDYRNRNYEHKTSREDDRHRPQSDSDRYRRREDSSSGRKLNFKRPDFDSTPSERGCSQFQSSSGRKNWKKPGYEDTKTTELKSESATTTKIEEKKAESIKEINRKHDNDDDRLLSTPEMIDLYDVILQAEADNNMQLARELKNKLEREQSKRVDAYNSSLKGFKDEKGRVVRLLTETDNRGFSRPAKASGEASYSRKRKIDTHEGKERVRYFADDDKYSLQDMFEKEKFNSQTEQDSTFYNLMKKAGDDDEAAFDNARIDNKDKEDRRNRAQAIRKYEAREKALDNCRWCISNNEKSESNIVLIKNKIYLAVPTIQSLTDRHCLIVPQSHVSCSTLLDEDVWDEIMDMRKTLVKAFEEDEDEDIVFFESALYIDRHPHMLLHCVPVPREIGDMAPIYFKKAIMECENEWSNNKKLVDLAGRNVRRAVPKGLPYFAVDFGMQSGYAHVIEDKKLFPHNFAQEIIGGMMDLDHSIWRKPKKDTPENIKKKVESLKQLLKD